MLAHFLPLLETRDGRLNRRLRKVSTGSLKSNVRLGEIVSNFLSFLRRIVLEGDITSRLSRLHAVVEWVLIVCGELLALHFYSV